MEGLDKNISAISSVGERFPDTEEVTGSIPVSRTRSSLRAPWQAPACHADVAQVVAHHLAKVRGASSSLVIRSGESAPPPWRGTFSISSPLRLGVRICLGSGSFTVDSGTKSQIFEALFTVSAQVG